MSFLKLTSNAYNIRPLLVRFQSTISLATDSKPIKSFNEVPGPRRFPLVGSLFSIKGFGGELDVMNAIAFCKELNAKYGDLVRFDILDYKQIYVFNPELIKKIFAADGEMPSRPIMDVFQKYYNLRKKPMTLVNSQGEQWRKLRSASNPIAARPKTVYSFLPKHNQVVEELVSLVNSKLDKNSSVVMNKFDDLLKLCALEMVSVVAFDQPLNCVNENNRTEFVSRVVSAIDVLFEVSGRLTFSPPIWKYYPTQDWKRFVAAADIVYDTVTDFVNAGLNDLDKRSDEFKADLSTKSILQNFLLTREKYGLTLEDVVALTGDFLIAGVDTTSAALSFILYELGIRQDLQDALYKELNSNLAIGEEITEEKLTKLPFLKAVLKETLRVHQIAPGNARVLQKDLVLDDYMIPKGTRIMMGSPAISSSDKYFKNAKSFEPCRWMKGETKEEIHPYSNLPFGFGARMCIGNRIAQQEIYLLTSKLIQNYKIEYLGEKPGYVTRLITSFDRPLEIKLTKRN